MGFFIKRGVIILIKNNFLVALSEKLNTVITCEISSNKEIVLLKKIGDVHLNNFRERLEYLEIEMGLIGNGCL